MCILRELKDRWCFAFMEAVILGNVTLASSRGADYLQIGLLVVGHVEFEVLSLTFVIDASYS